MKPIPERKFKRVVTALVLLLFPFQGYAVVETPQLPNPGKASMSRDKQIELGFQAASQVYQQMPVLPDSSPETEYIRKLGKRLVTVIPSEYSWPFQFHVIPQKEINAFALPGGPMFVNIGTITAASNEAELAGVTAHEMAHVYMQHSAKQAGKRQTTSTLAGIAGAIVGATTGGAVGSLAQAGIQLGTRLGHEIFPQRRGAGRRSGGNYFVQIRLQPTCYGRFLQQTGSPRFCRPAVFQ